MPTVSLHSWHVHTCHVRWHWVKLGTLSYFKLQIIRSISLVICVLATCQYNCKTTHMPNLLSVTKPIVRFSVLASASGSYSHRMLREDFSDLPRLRHWDFKTNNVNLGTIKSLDRVRLGQLSSFRYRSQVNTCLAASHILSDVTLPQAEQVRWPDIMLWGFIVHW